MIEWECPSFGCHGVLVTKGEPHFGQIVGCTAPEGVAEDRACRRLMRWSFIEGGWVPVSELPAG